MMDYQIVISPLSAEDGGGFLVFVPDLPGCMSDGETPEEALVNIRDAIGEWLDLAKERKIPIPQPGSAIAQAVAEHEEIVTHLREMTSHVEGVTARLDEVEKLLEDISDRLDHVSAWQRFAAIVDRKAAPDESVRRAGHC